jgi:hypothetical protein
MQFCISLVVLTEQLNRLNMTYEEHNHDKNIPPALQGWFEVDRQISRRALKIDVKSYNFQWWYPYEFWTWQVCKDCV